MNQGQVAPHYSSSYCILHCHTLAFLKSQFHLKMSLKQSKLLVLLNLNTQIHIFLTFCVTRLEGHIKHFCTTKHGAHRKEKHLCNCFELQAELITFFFPCNTIFSNYGYSNLGFWQTISQKHMKLACHFKENNCQHLLSMIKLELSSYIRI